MKIIYLGIPLVYMRPFMHNLTQQKFLEVDINPYFHSYVYLKSSITMSNLNSFKHDLNYRIILIILMMKIVLNNDKDITITPPPPVRWA